MNTSRTRCTILPRFDPRLAGERGALNDHGEYSSLSFNTSQYAGSEEGKGEVFWSVTLITNGRELVLIIQADRALCKLVLWDDLSFLGTAVFRISHESCGGGWC